MDLQKVLMQAPAKINLSLTVAPPRENGLHPISSKMAKIALFDDLELTRLDDHALSRYAILWHDDAPKPTGIDWPVKDDLAVRAHRALEEQVGKLLPVQLKLQKRIPVRGGLGGGSADAAAMLQATVALFDLDVDIQEIAPTIGSDVPFSLCDGAGEVSGIGEVVSPMQLDAMHLVLIIPDYGCETAKVYEAFDALGCKSEDGVLNDLLVPACKVEGRLAADFDALRKLSELEVHLSGSGSSMFIICDNAQQASALTIDIEKQTKHVALATQTYAPPLRAMERM